MAAKKQSVKQAIADGRRTRTIKPPPAPALLQSEDVGAPLSLDRAIEEKLRLYPRAKLKEIIAMFELEGVRVTPAAVEKLQRKAIPGTPTLS